MNFAITKTNSQRETNHPSSFWLNIVSAALIAGIVILAYTTKHESAVELQTAPWQTLLFIDNSIKTI